MAAEWPTIAASYVTGAQAVTGATELAVATVEIPTVAPGQTVELEGSMTETTGTTTTSVTCQVRRGPTTGGTSVATSGAVTVIGSAGGTNQYEVDGQDAPGDVAAQQYTLTVTNAGGGTGGSVVKAYLRATAHW